jgi:anti-sigma B factor antagonist
MASRFSANVASITTIDIGADMPLQITHEKSGTHVVLVVAGDLDLATAAQLTGEAGDLMAAGAHDVIIDASGLEFCDSAGLSAFVRISNQLESHAGRLAIARPTVSVRRVLEVTGLIDAFVVTESVTDATAKLGDAAKLD